MIQPPFQRSRSFPKLNYTPFSWKSLSLFRDLFLLQDNGNRITHTDWGQAGTSGWQSRQKCVSDFLLTLRQSFHIGTESIHGLAEFGKSVHDATMVGRDDRPHG